MKAFRSNQQRLVLVLFLFISSALYSQEILTVGGEMDTTELANDLLVEAQVLKNGQAFKGVEVGLETKGELIKLDETNEKGFFSVQLGFDSLHILVFKSSGYITKRVAIDTRNMPEEDKELGYDLGLFKLSMIKPSDEVNQSLYEKPVARFRYNSVSQLFVVDRAYKKEVKKRFEEKDQKPDVIKF